MATDDTDARFRALVSDEFGIDVAGPARREPTPPQQPYRPAGTFSFDRSLEAADPEPDEADRFVPPEPAPLRRPRRPITWVAIALLLCPVVLGTVRATGVATPGWLGALAAACFGIGLALCLFVLLPRHAEDPGDRGIRL